MSAISISLQALYRYGADEGSCRRAAHSGGAMVCRARVCVGDYRRNGVYASAAPARGRQLAANRRRKRGKHRGAIPAALAISAINRNKYADGGDTRAECRRQRQATSATPLRP